MQGGILNVNHWTIARFFDLLTLVRKKTRVVFEPGVVSNYGTDQVTLAFIVVD